MKPTPLTEGEGLEASISLIVSKMHEKRIQNSDKFNWVKKLGGKS